VETPLREQVRRRPQDLLLAVRVTTPHRDGGRTLRGHLTTVVNRGSRVVLRAEVRDTRPMSVYALNLFDVTDREEYLAYSRRSAAAVGVHGGRVVALGKFLEAEVGDIKPRQVMVLVEWESRQAFDSYCNDPELADLHPHRVNGTSGYIWHLFDRLDDLRPVLHG
jgi:uncharacterized protein (DUF1330 family)